MTVYRRTAGTLPGMRQTTFVRTVVVVIVIGMVLALGVGLIAAVAA